MQACSMSLDWGHGGMGLGMLLVWICSPAQHANGAGMFGWLLVSRGGSCRGEATLLRLQPTLPGKGEWWCKHPC